MLSAIKVVCLCLAAVGLIAVGEVFFRRQVGKTASNVSWTGCGGGDYVRVDSIRIVGDFTVGKDVVFVVSGLVKQSFTHASTDLKVQLKTLIGAITLFDSNVKANPVTTYTEGALTMETRAAITQDPPAGTYFVFTMLKNPENRDLQCVKITYKLS